MRYLLDVPTYLRLPGQRHKASFAKLINLFMRRVLSGDIYWR